ncbi:MAG: adenine deaminase [Clostridia bacterium]|nr:adenine deaminase [Clostridia bacterium]
MQLIKNKDRSRLTRAALGKMPCDLAIDNVKLVNVLTGEIYPAGVDILDGVIVRVRMHGEPCMPAAMETLDGGGHYLLPGFIDVHMHIESTMMVPENFGKAAVVWGTTTAVTDPHEIGNVMGIPGVRYMLESARRSPLRIYTLAPSCVPSVPHLEGAGAAFFKKEVAELLCDEDVIGVAEVMDYIGVINDDPRMHEIIDAGIEAGGFIQGHAPYVMGNDLCAYLCGGPVSDHEVRMASELSEKLRMGMHVNIKSSSLSDTVQEFLKGIKNVPIHDQVSLCTDDVHAADLLTTGHINHIVNECVKGGIEPMDAMRFGTCNAARELHFEDAGAIAPGYVADLQLVEDLQFDKRPLAVYVAGKLVAKDGKLIGTEASEAAMPGVNTVNIPQITSPDVFGIHSEKSEEKLLVFSASRESMTPGQKAVYRCFPVENGLVRIPDLNENQFISVVNRHGSGDMTTVICSDFHLLHGCVASTISHDSHNMTIAYRTPEDAYVAAKELERIGGGMCYVEDGKVVYSLPLPVAGLMSPLTVDLIAPAIQKMDEAVEHASEHLSPMLLAIAILALPVRPGIIITDRGVVRGDTLEFIPQRLD